MRDGNGRKKHATPKDCSYDYYEYCSIPPCCQSSDSINSDSYDETTSSSTSTTTTTTITSRYPPIVTTTLSPSTPPPSTHSEAHGNKDVDLSGLSANLNILITSLATFGGTLTIGLSIRLFVKWRRGTLSICGRASAKLNGTEIPLFDYTAFNESSFVSSTGNPNQSIVRNPGHQYVSSTPNRPTRGPHPRIEEVETDPIKMKPLKTLKQIFSSKKNQSKTLELLETSREGNVTVHNSFVRFDTPTPTPIESKEKDSKGSALNEQIAEPSRQGDSAEAEGDSLTDFFENLSVGEPKGYFYTDLTSFKKQKLGRSTC